MYILTHHTEYERIFKYVVTPLKHRLPTWSLQTIEPYNSMTLQTPSDRAVCEVLMIQPVTPTDRGETGRKDDYLP
jgi:hypothetical protein